MTASGIQPPATMTAPKPQPADDTGPAADDDVGSWISALVDGQADAIDRGCALWRADASARRSWQTYHLIGDVLRSDELARPPSDGDAFLDALRGRLAAEPVAIAPQSAPARRRAPWLMPAAAAGVFVVAGVVVFNRLGASTPPSPVVAEAGGIAGLASPDPLAPAPTTAAFTRDPRLDEYLRAHRSALGGVAAAAPGGMLRRVDNDLTADPPR